MKNYTLPHIPDPVNEPLLNELRTSAAFWGERVKQTLQNAKVQGWPSNICDLARQRAVYAGTSARVLLEIGGAR